ncbi:ammonia-forming nitrite reductase [Thermincola ferriacetica]|uniref:nitrite reductase (cytochrome; ammonia-forming) n=1 Tax=Thermincola ferriacetica TaxID=281456 RepID=A0A0L6W6J2_9FIRM|nr:ammonia-forming cytochrome c nitrite reductase subunit c552 [Thermincola ferriacetica]KNZ71081.1 ammonia-forming nitrite reductase [Thermincola ferriacetica]
MKNSRSIGLLIIVFLALSVFVIGCSGNTKATSAKSSIGENEFDPAVWGKYYPLQYESYLKNNEGAKTEFGGSVKESKFIAEPEIVELFKGYGFSKEYNEDRGHTYALKDLLNSKRVGPKTPGSCLSCKTPTAPVLMQQMGAAYYTTPVIELAKKAKHAIACADCHDPKTMQLRVTRPAFIQAMKARGIDVNKASKKEMRSYVCGQCHVEYYFQTDTKEVIYPWANGIEPAQIEEYYDKINFSDWEHPDSKAKMRKVQHPEFETWSTGVHGSAGVSCSDCHMPYMVKDGKKYSSHWWTSPLKTIDISCQVCHQQDAKWLKERVHNTQIRTFNMQTRAAKTLVQAHEAIKTAFANPKADLNKLKKAQTMVVKAQWYWDWVAAENSRGFHNPVQALDSLGQAIDYAYQAIELARSAY